MQISIEHTHKCIDICISHEKGYTIIRKFVLQLEFWKPPRTVSDFVAPSSACRVHFVSIPLHLGTGIWTDRNTYVLSFSWEYAPHTCPTYQTEPKYYKWRRVNTPRTLVLHKFHQKLTIFHKLEWYQVAGGCTLKYQRIRLQFETELFVFCNTPRTHLGLGDNRKEPINVVFRTISMTFRCFFPAVNNTKVYFNKIFEHWKIETLKEKNFKLLISCYLLL